MDFEHSATVKALQQRLQAFMDEYIYPMSNATRAKSRPGIAGSRLPSLKSSSARRERQGCGTCSCPSLPAAAA